MMRKQFLGICMAVVAVSGLGLAAKGQTVDQIKVNIPYQFVVNGKTLPAGSYSVTRLSEQHEGALLLNNFEKHASVIVFPRSIENVSDNQSSVGFAEVGGQHFLSRISTASHVYFIPPSHTEIMQATAKPQSGASGAGSLTGSN
jgi:hypothetical protein